MHEQLRQLLAWLARLLPKQQNSGSGAVQVGRAGGSVKVVHLTQNIYVPPSYPSASPQPDLHPIRVSHPDRRAGPKRPCTKEAQSQVLALMDRVPDRNFVLDWMDRQFGTKIVIELDAMQLFRLRRYVEVILDAQSKYSA